MDRLAENSKQPIACHNYGQTI